MALRPSMERALSDDERCRVVGVENTRLPWCTLGAEFISRPTRAEFTVDMAVFCLASRRAFVCGDRRSVDFHPRHAHQLLAFAPVGWRTADSLSGVGVICDGVGVCDVGAQSGTARLTKTELRTQHIQLLGC